jgi:hypothetical protein
MNPARAPDDNAAPEGEEEIGLDAFYEEFIPLDGEMPTSSPRWRMRQPRAA